MADDTSTTVATDDEAPAGSSASGEVAERDQEQTPDPPQRWVWPAMDPDERVTRMEELKPWVDWLAATFPQVRSRLTRCWYQHDDVREVLTALYAGWIRTYAGDPTKISTLAELTWLKDLKAFLPDLVSPSCQASHQAPPPLGNTEQAQAAFTHWLDEGAFLNEPRFHPAQAQVAKMAQQARLAAST